MRSIPLPGSELRIPRMTLGCEPLGGTDWGTIDLREVGEAVAYARDHGVTMFDTADVYGLGLSEERLADVLGPSRHSVTIMTKGGVRWDAPVDGRAKTRIDVTPDYLESALNASLKRLKIDRVPIYLIYAPSADTSVAPAIAFLEKMREQGKVLHYGLSNFSVAQLEESCRHGRPTFLQARHSLIHRAHEADLFPAAVRHGIHITTYGTLAQGLLSGKFQPGCRFEASDRRHRLPHFSDEEMPKYDALLHRLAEVAARHKCSVGQVSLAWASGVAGVTSIVAGAKSIRQVVENAAAFDIELPDSDRRYLESDLSAR